MTDRLTPPGLALSPSASDGEADDYSSIGLYNGRMNYTLPLLNVQGRGQVGYAISLPINRSWSFEHWYDEFTHGWYHTPTDIAWWGQELRYMPGKLLGRSALTSGPLCQQPYGQFTLYAESRLSFISSDGSEATLVSRTYGEAGLPYVVHCSAGDPTAIYPSSRGTEFVSNDGSGMRFVSDQIITDASAGGGYFTTSGILYFPDGTNYRVDSGFVSWMKDKNGNKTSLSYDGNQYNSKLVQVTDSNGRIINISYNNNDATYGTHDRITYPGLNGGSRDVRVGYTQLASALRSGETLKTPAELFGYCNQFDPTCSVVSNPVVVSSVWFPGNRQFRYYYNSYAELARVETPLGGAFEYDWGGALDGGAENGVVVLDDTPEVFRQVLEKRVYPNGGNGPSYGSRTTINKSPPYDYSVDTVTVRTIRTTDNENNLLSKQTHHFYGNPVFPFAATSTAILALLKGREYETNYFGSDDVTRNRRDLTQWTTASLANLPADARVSRKTSIIFEADKAIADLEDIEYDGNGNFDYFSHLNVKRSKSYHFKPLTTSTAQTGNFDVIAGYFTSADVARLSESDYLYDQNYKARNITGLMTETRVLNPLNANDVFSKTQYVYDQPAYQDFNYTTTNWENPNSNLRGDATTTRTWVKETNTWIEWHSMRDNFGNVRKVWDVSGDPTRFAETEFSPVYKYAYATRTIAPAPDPTGVHGKTEGSEVSMTYDFNTGVVLSVTDANGQVATTEYDNRLRPIRVNPPAGGSVSETIYNDTPGNIWIKSRKQIDEYNWAESTAYIDGMGRTFKSRKKDSQGDVVTETKFDNFGRVKASSNPYRVDANGNSVENIYWSKPRYDEFSRVVETYAPALVDPNGSAHGPSRGMVQFGISTEANLIGAYTVATDASGRRSRATTGIYGLMRVDEPTGIGGTVDQDLGTLANPNQPTSYSYNVKGELVKITQGKSGQPTQYRYFGYDSFGRLIRVRQPEQNPNSAIATTGNPDNNQWTAAFTYDVFGKIITTTNAKNITITTEYDKAGRSVKQTYSDGTPQVELFYDGKGLPQVPQFSRGALTKVTSSVSETRFTSFDNHGRLLSTEQITDGQTYGFGYKYNLAGGLIEQTYPSGRIVRNFLEGDGNLSSVSSKPGNGFVKQVASSFDYAATGAVRKMKLGNNLWETTQQNERLQLTQVGLGTAQTNSNLLAINYEYGELSADGMTVDTAKNTGAIARSTTTVPTTSFTQTFKYDSINRLTEAKEKTGTATNWQQTFAYDRFGNRTQFSQTVNGTSLPINNVTHPTIDPATNRFTTGQGYTYDYNGNLIQDAEGRSFTFNGDDKQTEVRNASNQIVGQYFYDGRGVRVKKVVPSTGETTIFVYDAAGGLAAEYSTVAPPPSPTTSYLTTDHLGSPRVITDKNGNVVSRRDFMPFGEELGVGVGGRTESQKYSVIGSDNIRKRFTGYEKDDETQLDFAEARMYQNKHGRFTAIDPLLASAKNGNPQTFNRYVYVLNNPLNLTDPSGLQVAQYNDGCRFDDRGNVVCGGGGYDGGLYFASGPETEADEHRRIDGGDPATKPPSPPTTTNSESQSGDEDPESVAVGEKKINEAASAIAKELNAGLKRERITIRQNRASKNDKDFADQVNRSYTPTIENDGQEVDIPVDGIPESGLTNLSLETRTSQNRRELVNNRIETAENVNEIIRNFDSDISTFTAPKGGKVDDFERKRAVRSAVQRGVDAFNKAKPKVRLP